MDRERCIELVQESVDGSEYVIYTHKTWNVCWSSNSTEWDEAHCESETETLDKLLTISAYWLLVNRATETLDRLIEEREEVAA